jgi:hypothetical protein
VSLFDALQREARLAPTASGFDLTPAGRQWLQAMGMTPSVPNGRRRYAYRCLDWSERRDHLAGHLADELYRHFTESGWLRRTTGRAVEITTTGRRELLPCLSGEAP